MINLLSYSDDDFIIRNVYNYQTSLMMTKCDMTLFNGNSKIHIEPKSIVFLEKGIKFDLKLKKESERVPFVTYQIDDKTISAVIKFFEETDCLDISFNLSTNRNLDEKVFILGAGDLDILFFNKIVDTKDDALRVCKIAYLLSKIESRKLLYTSLNVSSSKSFYNQISDIIEGKLNKKWKISDIAESLCCSEISVRKKLENENINFNKLVLDIRMKHASKLILSTDCNVSSVSKLIGISSTSYFIKMFKQYFGITPKKYFLNLKRNL